MTLTPGTRLGAYRIVRAIGEGGMGAVFEAEHVALRVRRALKVFTTESEHRAFLLKRFAAEGRMLADLDHPRLVRVYDFAVDPESGTPYFAMDLVLSPSGAPETLEAACRRGVDEERVARWFADICEGLAYIHARGVVHRDISLDNILIGPDGRAVITDFGIAKITGEAYRRQLEVTRTLVSGDVRDLNMGKGLYMAPELKRGDEATPATDAYALGVLLFRILAGSWYTPDARLGEVFAGMDYNWPDLIARLCSAEPAARLGAEGVGALPAGLRKSVPPKSPRVSARAVLIALSASLGLAGIVLFALSLHRGESAADRKSARAPQSSEIVTFNVVDEAPASNALMRAVRRLRERRQER